MTNDMRNRLGYVYVLTNKNNRVLYVGSSSNLVRRISVALATKFHSGWISIMALKEIPCFARDEGSEVKLPDPSV